MPLEVYTSEQFTIKFLFRIVNLSGLPREELVTLLVENSRNEIFTDLKCSEMTGRE